MLGISESPEESVLHEESQEIQIARLPVNFSILLSLVATSRILLITFIYICSVCVIKYHNVVIVYIAITIFTTDIHRGYANGC